MCSLDGQGAGTLGLKHVAAVLATEVAYFSQYMVRHIEASRDQHTRGVVVADSVPRGEAIKDGTGRALNGGAADLGGRLPDQLSEVTPSHEVRALRGVVHAVVGPGIDLAVIPLVSDANDTTVGR
jgi:hypothetical protein